MPRRWNKSEEQAFRAELRRLYIQQNKSTKQIGELLGTSASTIFQRLQRLGIPSTPERKSNYLNKKKDIHIPPRHTSILAEFFGIMLGDGHVSHFQTVVTLGTKELSYVSYVANLMRKLFHTEPKISLRKDGYRDVYIGSVALTSWLKNAGLVSNKVASQVDAPSWIFERPGFMRAFLRGFFDTDGSIYALRFGSQISLTNRSLPLLRSLRAMLVALGYRPSELSGFCIYLTRKDDVQHFFRAVRPANTKHVRRFEKITRGGR